MEKEKIRTDRQVNFDGGIVEFHQRHPEINVNGMSRKLWWEFMKEDHPEEWIALQEGEKCSVEDFKPLDQVFPIPSESIPTFAPEGFFKGNIRKPKFTQLVLGLPENFVKGFIEHAEKCWNEHLPFSYLDCLEDFKNGKF